LRAESLAADPRAENFRRLPETSGNFRGLRSLFGAYGGFALQPTSCTHSLSLQPSSLSGAGRAGLRLVRTRVAHCPGAAFVTVAVDGVPRSARCGADASALRGYSEWAWESEWEFPPPLGDGGAPFLVYAAAHDAFGALVAHRTAVLTDSASHSPPPPPPSPPPTRVFAVRVLWPANADTVRRPTTGAPGLGSPLPHLRRDCACSHQAFADRGMP
jgi:hypothetical protein